MGSHNGETLNFAFLWVAGFLLIIFSKTTLVKKPHFLWIPGDEGQWLLDEVLEDNLEISSKVQAALCLQFLHLQYFFFPPKLCHVSHSLRRQKTTFSFRFSVGYTKIFGCSKSSVSLQALK